MQSMPHVDLVTFEYCDINVSCLHLSVIHLLNVHNAGIYIHLMWCRAIL